MFSQACVILLTGGFCLWREGVCLWREGGLHLGVCLRGGLHGGGSAWRRVCMKEGLHGGGSAWRRGVCMEGGSEWRWIYMEGQTPRYGQPAGGTHPTGMDTCLTN